MSEFDIGQEVICVDASPVANPRHNKHPLVRGRIYVVLATPGIRCVEIDATRNAWLDSHFRPLGRRTSSIDFAYEILRKANKRDKKRVRA